MDGPSFFAGNGFLPSSTEPAPSPQLTVFSAFLNQQGLLLDVLRKNPDSFSEQDITDYLAKQATLLDTYIKQLGKISPPSLPNSPCWQNYFDSVIGRERTTIFIEPNRKLVGQKKKSGEIEVIGIIHGDEPVQLTRAEREELTSLGYTIGTKAKISSGTDKKVSRELFSKLAPLSGEKTEQRESLLNKLLFPQGSECPDALDVNCYLVAAEVKPFYFPKPDEDDVLRRIEELDRAGLSVSRLPSGELIVHKSDRTEALAAAIKSLAPGQHLEESRLMLSKTIPEEPYFLIEFFADHKEDEEYEIAVTRIPIKDFTPTTRLDVVDKFNKYKQALSPHFTIYSLFQEVFKDGAEKDSPRVLGLPAGRF